MTTLLNEIKTLETKISSTDNKYKVRSLKSKLSYLKAELKGNIVTKENLSEYRSLIIYTVKQTKLDLKTVMISLMNEKIVYKTSKGMKSEITKKLNEVIETLELEAIRNSDVTSSETQDFFQDQQEKRMGVYGRKFN